MNWSVLNQRIKIFHDFRVFVLCPIAKNENSKILEVHQKRQNTEIWWTKHWKAKIVLLIWWFFLKSFLKLFIWIFFSLRKLFTRKNHLKILWNFLIKVYSFSEKSWNLAKFSQEILEKLGSFYFAKLFYFTFLQL